MDRNVLLGQVMDSEMCHELKKDLVLFINNDSRSVPKGIPVYRNKVLGLCCDEIYDRMKKVAGGTGSAVAAILGISPQALNNQLLRGNIGANNIVEFCKITGVSLDWLVGFSERPGNDLSYVENNYFKFKNITNNVLRKKYLSLVETYDQLTGLLELKWCVTQPPKVIKYGKSSVDLPDDYCVVLSIINRYRDAAGTPSRVRDGIRRFFQVRKILTYVAADARTIHRMDAMVKKLSYDGEPLIGDRTGKTEFRSHSSKSECLLLLRECADFLGCDLRQPKISVIPWDLFLGVGGFNPGEWVISKYREESPF